MDIFEDEEEVLMMKLVYIEVVEWIDKYYIIFFENQYYKLQIIFEVYGFQIFGWNEVNEIFSDFNDVNLVKVLFGVGFVKRDCRFFNFIDMFVLFLYVKDLLVKFLCVLKMLVVYISDIDERLDVGVFLLYDLIVMYGDLVEDFFLKF